MSNPEITISIDDLVATVEIHRPPHNFFDFEMIRGLADSYESIDANPAARAIVLCSEGKAFCAGANFTERTNSPNGTYGLYVFGSGANSAVWGERDLTDTAGILLAELTGTYDDDQYAEAAAYSRATSTDTAILLAVRSSASGAYLLENRDDDHIRIGKTTHADDFTELADSGVISINDNDVMRLEVLGSTITAYLNDVAILSVVDTTFTTGKPGLGHRTLGALEVGDGTWDDFEAGDLVSAGVPVKALGAPRHLLAFERDDNEAQLLVSSPGAVEAFETGTPEGV